MPHTISKAGILWNFRHRATPAMLHYFFLGHADSLRMKDAELWNVKPRSMLDVYSVSEKFTASIFRDEDINLLESTLLGRWRQRKQTALLNS